MTHLVQVLPNSETQVDPSTAQAQRLAELAAVMDRPSVFQKGQLVRWKAGLRNKSIPAYNEPAIVREVLTVAVYDSCETARCTNSPYFGETLTLVLAVVDPDGDFVEYRYDGRRFEPMTSVG